MGRRGTTIQPNYPVKSISIKEFNIVPNSNGNDLVFNKTVLVYSDSVSIVPEDKTWKLESIQNNDLVIGDYVYGGNIFKINSDNSGLVYSDNYEMNINVFDAILHCQNLVYNGYDDWYLPSEQELIKLFSVYGIDPKIIGEFWSSTPLNNDYYKVQSTYNGYQLNWGSGGALISAICVRQF